MSQREPIEGMHSAYAAYADAAVRELEGKLAAVTAERDVLREALEEAALAVCETKCPTTWNSALGRTHHPLCDVCREALGRKDGGR